MHVKKPFRLSFSSKEQSVPATSAEEIVRMLREMKGWDCATIDVDDFEVNRASIWFRPEHGFVFQYFGDEIRSSEFLVTHSNFSSPSVEVELGGQALEQWPSELFVPEEQLLIALRHFLATGRKEQQLTWVQIDRFPRLTIWEGEAGRTRWERLQSATRRATEVFEDAVIAELWLREPSIPLGGIHPIDLLGSEEGLRQILAELTAIEHGLPI